MTALLCVYTAETYYVQIKRNNEEKPIFQHGPNGNFESGYHYAYPSFNVEAGDIISIVASGSQAYGYLTSYTPIINE